MPYSSYCVTSWQSSLHCVITVQWVENIVYVGEFIIVRSILLLVDIVPTLAVSILNKVKIKSEKEVKSCRANCQGLQPLNCTMVTWHTHGFAFPLAFELFLNYILIIFIYGIIAIMGRHHIFKLQLRFQAEQKQIDDLLSRVLLVLCVSISLFSSLLNHHSSPKSSAIL